VPTQPIVEVPLLELLADVVAGDVLRPRRPPDPAGDEDGAHGLVRELDESILHERDDRHSLAGQESDVRTVSEAWFAHDTHISVEQFVCSLPVAYFQFHTHDRSGGSTRYEMNTLFRVFLLKELHGWEHETALADYLKHRSDLCVQLGLERVPDQSTLWRSWNKRFTADLRETVEAAARTILMKAQNEDVDVP
jgi:hypothetical protein